MGVVTVEASEARRDFLAINQIPRRLPSQQGQAVVVAMMPLAAALALFLSVQRKRFDRYELRAEDRIGCIWLPATKRRG